MKFISTPNLPKQKVSLFIADTHIEDAVVVTPPKTAVLPYGLQRHADLTFCQVSENKAVCPPDTYEYYKEVLSPYGVTVICGKTALSCNYPEDSAYNVCIVGKKCFLNKSVCDEVLFDILTSEGYEIVCVRQGYTKCSICPIDENTIITADYSIAKEAEKLGMDVLVITNNTICLPGYDNGFFGGCAGMGDKDLLFINGELKTHPDGEKIRAFLHNKSIKIKELKKGPLTDIGSILPLMI